MAQRKVTAIPATITKYTAVPIGSKQKRRVAGYARVSTDHEDQVTSYEAQVDYYTNYIEGRDDWEFVAIYTDEGISATNTKRHEGFKAMVADALPGDRPHCNKKCQPVCQKYSGQPDHSTDAKRKRCGDLF